MGLRRAVEGRQRKEGLVGTGSTRAAKRRVHATRPNSRGSLPRAGRPPTRRARPLTYRQTQDKDGQLSRWEGRGTLLRKQSRAAGGNNTLLVLDLSRFEGFKRLSSNLIRLRGTCQLIEIPSKLLLFEVAVSEEGGNGEGERCVSPAGASCGRGKAHESTYWRPRIFSMTSNWWQRERGHVRAQVGFVGEGKAESGSGSAGQR